MGANNKEIYTQLHTIEDDIIQLSGLIKALQQIQSDDGASVSVVSAIDERFESLKKRFYKHWEVI